MCAHFDPAIDPMRLGGNFGVYPVPLGMRSTLWPGYHGPFVRKHEFAYVGDEAVPERELLVGSFGLIPHWAKDATFAKRTYNARSETAHEKPSYRDAWKQARHCIIPADAIYEPDWCSGKSVPARISRADGLPMGIAGLWSAWNAPTGETVHSFTMLTINADNHPLMRSYHKPEDEKRMVVILHEQDYGDWLDANAAESREFLRQYPAERLHAESPRGQGLFS
ncbi:MAG: SOS response-associated peptidase [Flavobacteriales bacterium]|nr:MAG: SOS response-associated peptidase [Flavobacteriales bacterium]